MKALSAAYAVLFFYLAALSPLSLYAAASPDVAGATSPLPSLAPMLEKTTPGVVNIATRGTVRLKSSPLFEDPFFRHFFDMPQRPLERRTQSLGSGVIVDAEEGYILTNYHVIASADEIAVTLNDGRQLTAKVVGSDPDADVAVIQVEAEDLTAVPWGNSDQLRVGDFVVAIGNPFGLGQTVTSGIVSALGRSGLGIEAYEDFIQTDASINPGNSGGALVDLNGRLIGINTAIIGPAGGNIGIGFAIPANMARQIMNQLIKHGEVRRGQLGIVIQDLNPELAKAFGLEMQRGGVVISRVESGSAAAEAGLKPGDIITEVNGQKIKNSADIRNVIGLQRIGQVVNMTVIRDGKKRTVKAVIAEPKLTVFKGEELHPRLEGAQLGAADVVLKQDDARGLLVMEIEPYSPAAASGLRQGDIITSINRQSISNLEEARRAIKNGGRGVLLNIQRGNAALFMVLQ
ncbi:MAG TPA: DegQ family serine endoprotease [Gammaproteobacteria bacterium]|jgi:serine protease Do/serine protease DegQ